MMLAPVVLTLGIIATRPAAHGRDAGPPASRAAAPMPWFVLGFIAMVILNSIVTIPDGPKVWITYGTTFLLSMALAAMGIETDFRKLKAKGTEATVARCGGLDLYRHFGARTREAYGLFS